MSNLGSLAAHELLRIFRDSRIRRLFLWPPLVLFILYLALYSPGQFTDLSTIILDQDNSALSREIVDGFSTQSKLKFIGMAATYKEVEKAVQSGRAQVAVVIPKDLEQRVSRGKSTEISVIVDGSNLTFANNALTATSDVISNISGRLGISLLTRQGMMTEKAVRVLSQLDYREHIWYNPTFNYAQFLVFFFFIVTFQQAFLMGTALSVSYDRADGTWEQACRESSESLVLAAKMTAYISIGLLQIEIAIIAGKCIGALPVYGSAGLLILVNLMFLLVLALFAVVVARLASPINSLRITMFMALPSMALSGYTWPLSAMHPFIRFLGECLPITWYADCFRAITLKGTGWSGIAAQMGMMLIMLAVLLAANLFIGHSDALSRLVAIKAPEEADSSC